MKAAADKLRAWRADPLLFVREVLRAEPDAWQVDVLRAFPREPRIALKACKGPGKSTVMAWCGWNFLLTRPHPKVVATSISGDNLRDGLWTEFAKWQGRSELLRQAFTWSAERIVANGHEETWWAAARTWSQSADPTQQANTMAGVHADYVFMLVDEAGGVPDGVVAAAEGNLSTGIETKLFLSGNPTHLSGPLYRACTRDRARYWVKEITSDPDDPARTPRVSKEWAQQQIDSFGRDSPFVMVNVLGQFPPAQENTLIGPDVAAAATRRHVELAAYENEAKVLGVDVARFGDDRTVLQARQGRMSWPAKVFRNLDTVQVAGQVAYSFNRWQPDAVFIDASGGYGGGVLDQLLELGYPVIGVEFGGKPLEGKFANRRAEMWWNTAEWLRGGGCLPPDDGELVAELTAPTYRFDRNGRIVLEAKEDLKKRGLPSPDKADAFALTFAQPVLSRGGARNAHLRKSTFAEHDYDPHEERPRPSGGGFAEFDYDPF